MSPTLPRRWRLALLGIATAASLAPTANAAGIGAVAPRAGELDVFLRHDGDGSGTDPNADSLVQLQRYEGAWRSPVNIGGRIHADSEIVATSPATGTIDLAVRWTDNSIRTREWTDSAGWGSWTTLGTGATAGPSITAYDSGKLAIVWRDASGDVAIRHRTGTTWAAAGTLVGPNIGADTSPAVTANGAGLEINYYDTFSTPIGMALPAGGTPEVETDWSDPLFLFGLSTSTRHTIAMGAGRFGATGASRSITQYFPNPSGTGSTRNLGGTVAGSTTTSRPGESTIINTPASAWSYVHASDGTPQADLLWRTDNGCVSTKSTTSPTTTGTWTAASTVPTATASSRCVWPNRVGTAPLMKRTDTSDTSDFDTYQSAFYPTMIGRNATTDWFNSRDQALVIHQGTNWPTAWTPRNFHPSAWAYRKSTSYQTFLGLQNNTPTSNYFVRRTDNNHLVGLGYGCTSSGCPQLLLNVTSTAARNYWLLGSDMAITTGGSCQGEDETDGALDLLACMSGVPSWDWKTRGNVKGLWLDDVLLQLTQFGNSSTLVGTDPSFIADAVTGTPLTNSQVGSVLPFTAAQWSSGLASLLEQLRAGIDILKGQGKLRTDEGKVAINFKWNNYATGPGSSPITISPTSDQGRAFLASDFIEYESGWVDGGLSGGAGITQPWSFARKQAFVDQVHGLGRNMLEEVTVCGEFAEFQSTECNRVDNSGNPITQTTASAQAHNTVAQYNYAATLLAYQSGDWVGDISDYYNRGWDGYQTDIGQPTAARTLVNSSYPYGAQQRTFELGRTIVVPPAPTACTNNAHYGCLRSDGLVHVAVTNGSRWRPTGSNTLSTVTTGEVALAPRRGAVLLNP